MISRLPTNMILESVLDVLTYECGQRHRPYGNGLGNLREFYVKYRDYMARFRKDQPQHHRSTDGVSKQQLFFAKVDIEKCYDRIHQDYLLDIVQNLVLHNTYVVQTVKMDYANTSGGAGDHNSLRFKKIVETIEDYHSFHRREHSLARQRQSTVFELLRCSLVEKQKVLKLLREHLLQHIVVIAGRHDEKLLLQSCGISQGSTISMLLCNLYYGVVEQSMLGGKDRRAVSPLLESSMVDAFRVPKREETGGEQDMVSRFVDDFLFISPDHDSFREFLDKTHKGNPELGARINPDKTLVNVEASIKIPAKGRGTNTIALACSDRVMNNGRKLFPWCGLLFDTETGEVLVNYERFRGGKLLQSLTIDSDGSEGQKLAHRLKAFLFPRCLPILYDASINSFATIVTNFYQMMLFGACKTAEYIRGRNTAMKRSSQKIDNADFLLRCIRDLARYAIKNIRSNSKTSIHGGNERAEETNPNQVFRFRIGPKIASALSLQAFSDVFAYISGFCTISRLLREEFSLLLEGIPGKRREELRRITARSWDDFRINNMIEK